MSDDHNFLDDFDVDAAIPDKKVGSARRKPLNPYKKSTKSPSQKLSMATPQLKQTKIGGFSSPFGQNSKFTMTSKVNESDCSPLPDKSNAQKRRNLSSQSSYESPSKKSATSDNSSIKDIGILPEDKKSDNMETVDEQPLLKTLEKYFGYNSFRSGQLSAISNVLNKRDTAVFWATGKGKSLVYQIPPIHTGKIAVVVSPLISLMEDQVSKLNAITDKKDFATFLGSGQTDLQAESRALAGEYSLIYCTPEKLTSNDGRFLDDLGKLHSGGLKNGKELCLIAIDESHCVR
jgi:superfamily II DNA helicase RecQ